MKSALAAAVLLVIVPLHAGDLRVVMTSNVRQECPLVDTACTNFDDTELYCACFLRGESWKAEAKIEARPVVYLSHPRFMLHEVSHMYDFDYAARRYVRRVGSMGFESREACEEFAADARRTFPEFLRSVVMESMRLRDPSSRFGGAPWKNEP